jgi:hypothetical protein
MIFEGKVRQFHNDMTASSPSRSSCNRIAAMDVQTTGAIFKRLKVKGLVDSVLLITVFLSPVIPCNAHV